MFIESQNFSADASAGREKSNLVVQYTHLHFYCQLSVTTFFGWSKRFNFLITLYCFITMKVPVPA